MATELLAFPSFREASPLLGGPEVLRLVTPLVTIDMVDEHLQDLHSHFVKSADLLKETFLAAQGLHDEMREVRSWRVDFSEKLDNTLAVQRNRHSRALDSRLHRITKRQQDGSWICPPGFPKTVRRLRRLNGEKEPHSYILRSHRWNMTMPY
jgi:hypothetical protein